MRANYTYGLCATMFCNYNSVLFHPYWIQQIQNQANANACIAVTLNNALDLSGYRTAIGLLLEIYVQGRGWFRVRHGVVDRLGFS